MLLTIEESILLLKSGNIICVETDTIPGLAADAYNEEAIKKIYKLKNRNTQKKLVWMTHSIQLIESICLIPKEANLIIKNHWPGALTLIFPIKSNPKKTQAFRIPNHPTLLILLENLQRPLAVTSINKSGNTPITNLEKIPQNIKKDITGILKGRTPVDCKNICSTIIKFSCDGTFQLLRTGTLKLIDLSSSSS